MENYRKNFRSTKGENYHGHLPKKSKQRWRFCRYYPKVLVAILVAVCYVHSMFRKIGEESQGLFKLRLSSYEGLKLFNDTLSADTNFNIFNKKSNQHLQFLKPKLNFIFNRHFS